MHTRIGALGRACDRLSENNTFLKELGGIGLSKQRILVKMPKEGLGKGLRSLEGLLKLLNRSIRYSIALLEIRFKNTLLARN